MHNTDIPNGSPHAGIYLTSLTIILYVISMSTLNQVAAVCTILAAITTVLVNLKRFFAKK